MSRFLLDDDSRFALDGESVLLLDSLSAFGGAGVRLEVAGVEWPEARPDIAVVRLLEAPSRLDLVVPVATALRGVRAVRHRDTVVLRDLRSGDALFGGLAWDPEWKALSSRRGEWRVSCVGWRRRFAERTLTQAEGIRIRALPTAGEQLEAVAALLGDDFMVGSAAPGPTLTADLRHETLEQVLELWEERGAVVAISGDRVLSAVERGAVPSSGVVLDEGDVLVGESDGYDQVPRQRVTRRTVIGGALSRIETFDGDGVRRSFGIGGASAGPDPVDLFGAEVIPGGPGGGGDQGVRFAASLGTEREVIYLAATGDVSGIVFVRPPDWATVTSAGGTGSQLDANSIRSLAVHAGELFVGGQRNGASFVEVYPVRADGTLGPRSRSGALGIGRSVVQAAAFRGGQLFVVVNVFGQQLQFGRVDPQTLGWTLVGRFSEALASLVARGDELYGLSDTSHTGFQGRSQVVTVAPATGVLTSVGYLPRGVGRNGRTLVRSGASLGVVVPGNPVRVWWFDPANPAGAQAGPSVRHSFRDNFSFGSAISGPTPDRFVFFGPDRAREGSLWWGAAEQDATGIASAIALTATGLSVGRRSAAGVVSAVTAGEAAVVDGTYVLLVRHRSGQSWVLPLTGWVAAAGEYRAAGSTYSAALVAQLVARADADRTAVATGGLSASAEAWRVVLVDTAVDGVDVEDREFRARFSAVSADAIERLSVNGVEQDVGAPDDAWVFVVGAQQVRHLGSEPLRGPSADGTREADVLSVRYRGRWIVSATSGAADVVDEVLSERSLDDVAEGLALAQAGIARHGAVSESLELALRPGADLRLFEGESVALTAALGVALGVPSPGDPEAWLIVEASYALHGPVNYRQTLMLQRGAFEPVFADAWGRRG